MDSTLLGALIGAGAAIAGSIVTAIATYFINKSIDKNKLLTEKKEVLFQTIIEIERAMYRYYVCFNLALNGGKFNLEPIDENRDRAIARLEIVSNIYFNNLELSDLLESIIKYEQESVIQIREPYFKGSVTYEQCNIAKENYDKIPLATRSLKGLINQL